MGVGADDGGTAAVAAAAAAVLTTTGVRLLRAAGEGLATEMVEGGMDGGAVELRGNPGNS